MPAPPPPEKTRWKKGQSGNPKGRPTVREELRAVPDMTVLEVTKTIAKYLRMDKTELHAAITDEKTSMMELNIAAGLAYGSKTGDLSKLSWLLDRVIGRIPTIEKSEQQIVVSDAAPQIVLTLPSNKKEAAG